MFRKVLVANRGEIACRIITTCQRLGVETVAVYSDADSHSRHVRLASEAIRIGPGPAQQSYLHIGSLLNAAKLTNSQAIHPGYGFLSENEGFAAACEQAGVVFVGPPASAIRAMGSKSEAKALMAKAGVPLTPGYHGERQDPTYLKEEADSIGYPILIKASAGGGGKGMRRVDNSNDFLTALSACRREAEAAFGDARVLLERYILQPRHIEIQIFADAFGNVLSLFERDCSVQRRHQKVIEEAPAPGMSPSRRDAMGKAACDAARAVGYVGAGTVEFIADQLGVFHFMEMNTRLQVEHPVTEMITGLDLVEWQLRVAAGEPLPLRQEEIHIRGHAIETRIYAEDPSHNFLPSTGTLAYYRQPAISDGIRVDAGVEQGDQITTFYDPMIAKLIAWGQTRDSALERLGAALKEFQIVGVCTNVAFLRRLIATPSFAQARLDTALIEREHSFLHAEDNESSVYPCFLASLAHLLAPTSQQSDMSPWSIIDGWRTIGSSRRSLLFQQHGSEPCIVDVEYLSTGFRLQRKSVSLLASGTYQGDGTLIATLGDEKLEATVVKVGEDYHVFHVGRQWTGTWLDPFAADQSSEDAGSLLAPLPGRITSVLVRPGDDVEKGRPLLTMEAMKMEYSVEAPGDGKVQAIFFAEGEQVQEGAQLISFLEKMDAE